MHDTSPANTTDDDEDSLFGSPPPSPPTGRSPSPLALPSGTAQNVGTLALPGSHLVAELPVHPPASLPLSVNGPPISGSQDSLSVTRPRIPLQALGTSSRRTNSTSQHSPLPRARKGKQKEKSTPRPTPPPISLPSPDEPPPPHFLRNQQALLGLAGMVGGINPAHLSKTPLPRGSTVENPIIVEDDLPRSANDQIVGTLLQQSNIFPVVIGLLRLLLPRVPSLAPLLSTYPSSNTLVEPQTRSQSPTQTSCREQSPGSSSSVPPLKRRKLNTVPAGVADWDVPYPFQAGQVPVDYHHLREHDRLKRLLAELAQLVHRSTERAAIDAWSQRRQPRQSLAHSPSMGHYRTATLYYGLERGTAAQSGQPGSATVVHTRSGTSTPSSSGIRTPALKTTNSSSPRDPPQESIVQLVESILLQNDQGVASKPAHMGDTSSSFNVPTFTSNGNTQAFFDNWLEMLDTFPPDNSDDGIVDTSTSPTPHSQIGAVATTPNPIPSTPLPNHPMSNAVFSFGGQERENTSMPPTHPYPPNPLVPTGEHAFATPTSPSMTVTSLTESADAGPLTPSFDWGWSDKQDAALDMKLLDALAEMDVDLESVMRDFQVLPPPLGGTNATCAVVSESGVSPDTTELCQSRSEQVPAQGESAALHALAAPLPGEGATQSGSPHVPDATQPPPAMASPYAAPSFSCVLPPVQPSTAAAPPPPRPSAADVDSGPKSSARAKGKARAVPSVRSGVAGSSSSTGTQERRAALEKARALRVALVAEVERAKIALWETTLEQGVLVGLGRELEKGKGRE